MFRFSNCRLVFCEYILFFYDIFFNKKLFERIYEIEYTIMYLLLEYIIICPLYIIIGFLGQFWQMDAQNRVEVPIHVIILNQNLA